MALRALLFDVDGTLADTEHDGHLPAFNRAFAEAGLPWRWDDALYDELLAVTGGKERIRHYVQAHRRETPLPPSVIAELHERKTAHYEERMATGTIAMRPGVLRLLGEARAAGLGLAIATTTTPANVTALLRHAAAPEAESWFDVIGAGDMVAAKKPAPDIYEYVLRELGLDAEECLAFEDSEHGLCSARAAGLATIVTTSYYTREQGFDGALLVVDHLGEPWLPFSPRFSQYPLAAATCVDVPLLRRLHGRVRAT